MSFALPPQSVKITATDDCSGVTDPLSFRRRLIGHIHSRDARRSPFLILFGSPKHFRIAARLFCVN